MHEALAGLGGYGASARWGTVIETAPGTSFGTTVDGGSVSRRSANAKPATCAKQAHLCRFGPFPALNWQRAGTGYCLLITAYCPSPPPESEARRNPLPLSPSRSGSKTLA